MRLRLWRRPNVKRALRAMAAADAYCADHGHNWQQGEPGRHICPRCGLERATTNADIEAEINDWNKWFIEHHRDPR